MARYVIDTGPSLLTLIVVLVLIAALGMAAVIILAPIGALVWLIGKIRSGATVGDILAPIGGLALLWCIYAVAR